VKVVLDTNVVLSALFTRGICEAILDVCIERECLVLSDYILEEFAEHAMRKFGAPADEVRAAVEFLRRNAEIVTPEALPAESCRDPDDVPVLGTAVAAQADALVSGDGDLLGLKSIAGIPILSPRVFYERSV
jgi:uncharacterized protein